jgi:hypothetical protein
LGNLVVDLVIVLCGSCFFFFGLELFGGADCFEVEVDYLMRNFDGKIETERSKNPKSQQTIVNSKFNSYFAHYQIVNFKHKAEFLVDQVKKFSWNFQLTKLASVNHDSEKVKGLNFHPYLQLGS